MPKEELQMVSLMPEFAKNEKILVILGDNIFRTDLKSAIGKFEQRIRERLFTVLECRPTHSSTE